MRFWKKVILLILILFGLIGAKNAEAQANNETSFEAKVEKVVEEKQIEIEGQRQLYQKLELKVLTGQEKDQMVTVENGNQAMANVIEYETGQKVIVTKDNSPDGTELYTITDFVRRDSLWLLGFIFVILTVLIARWKGVMSMLSMVFTFVLVFMYVLPNLSNGANPILVATIASVIIIPISFYMAHGVSQKTTVAIVSSVAALGVTAVLSVMFISLGRLTGLSSEEAGMLLVQRSGNFDMKGLLLCGIIIGALGVLDDITISQASIVNELIKGSEKPKGSVIYKQAMNVGRDHISSMVNTLVLAYAGASLPLLLIFVDNPHSFSEIINYEFLAEEIIRTLVGSIGLILAVPITTLIAVNWIRKNKDDKLPKK
jgi:uncharacterized membrane protein